MIDVAHTLSLQAPGQTPLDRLVENLLTVGVGRLTVDVDELSLKRPRPVPHSISPNSIPSATRAGAEVRSSLRILPVTAAPHGTTRFPQGLALLVASHVAPENIDDVGGARLVFGSGQPVQLVSEFLWNFDDAWHRFLW
jgi:hypothetical protein